MITFHMPPVSLLLVLAATLIALGIRRIATRRRRELRHAYWTPARGEPDWFDWPFWGAAIGCDERFKPKGERERIGYVMGLRDAARIVEETRHIRTPINRYVERAGCKPAIKAIHAYTLDFLGLPAKVQSDNWSDDA